MSLTDDLYRDIILEHFKNPRNPGRVDPADILSQGTNPFCGDELELTLRLEGDRIQEIKAEAKGCSISQASVSMMTEAVMGKTLQEADALIKRFKATMLENAPWIQSEETEDLEALEGVKKYPVRIKCAVLSWNTLHEGIQAHHNGKSQATHVEGEEGDRPDLALQMEETPAMEPEETPPAPSTEEQVREALKKVIDPELNMNILDLGLIYGVELPNANSVKITYTLTSPGCPLGPVIKGQIDSTLGRIPWVENVDAQLVWKPPWDPRTMASDEVKTELGIW